MKPPEKRSEDEKQTLEKFDIDRDLTAQRGGDVSRLGNQVMQLHRTIEENTDSDAVNATNAVLETVGRLDFDQTSVDLEKNINEFKSEIEEISEIEDTAEQDPYLNDSRPSASESHDSGPMSGVVDMGAHTQAMIVIS